MVGIDLVEDLVEGGTTPHLGGSQPVWLSCPTGIGGDPGALGAFGRG
jgi:hypothetical protein